MEFEKFLGASENARDQHAAGIWDYNPFDFDRKFFEPFYGTDEEFQRACADRIPLINDLILIGNFTRAKEKDTEERNAMLNRTPKDKKGREILL
jgi:hypothetical protein